MDYLMSNRGRIGRHLTKDKQEEVIMRTLCPFRDCKRWLVCIIRMETGDLPTCKH